MGVPAGSRELVVGVGLIVALSRFVDTPVAWALALLVLGATAFGTLQVLGDMDPAVHARGVPIESLADPAVLAFTGVGVMRLVPVGLLLVPAVGLLLWLLLRDIGIEARLARATTPPSAADRTAVLGMTIVAGFGAFLAIAALVPAALPDAPGGAGGAAAVVNPSQVLGLAASDGLAAFLLAYRVAALRSSSLRDVGWAASLAAGVVAIAAAALRVLEIPGLLGPALLVLVLFLWEAIHGGAPTRRRDPRRLWETLLLVALGLIVIAWSLGLRA
jgi:hypothetical protein